MRLIPYTTFQLIIVMVNGELKTLHQDAISTFIVELYHPNVMVVVRQTIASKTLHGSHGSMQPYMQQPTAT